MNIHTAFRRGAEQLAGDFCQYTELHKGHGIDPFHWKILTQKEYWAPEQARSIRSILANVLEVSMTIAGMPAIPLPGQYTAALIATIVAPSNRFIACTKAPDTFDAVIASGLQEEMRVVPMKVEQLMSLVMAYSGGIGAEPEVHKLPKVVGEQMAKHSKK